MTAEPVDELTLRTEEIGRFYQHDGRLFVPAEDPQGHNSPAGGDAIAIASAPGAWTNNATFDTFPTHVFDVAENDDGVWLAGAVEADPGQDGHAVIWRSTDGGVTFTESLTEAVPMFDDTNSTRYYSLIAVGPDLYVQRTGVADEETGAGPVSYRWNGTTHAWVEHGQWQFPASAEPSAGKTTAIDPSTAIFLHGASAATGQPYPTEIMRITPAGDESTWFATILAQVTDYDLDDAGNVYAIQGAHIVRCADVTAETPAWVRVGRTPTGALSMAVSADGTTAWIGATASIIWTVQLT